MKKLEIAARKENRKNQVRCRTLILVKEERWIERLRVTEGRTSDYKIAATIQSNLPTPNEVTAGNSRGIIDRRMPSVGR
jgi:hypothetical protein